MSDNMRLVFTGQPKIFLNHEEITDQFSVKSLALIFYLYANKNKQVKRSRLAQLLWENSDEQAAKYNLRYNIWTINKWFSSRDKGQKLIEANRSLMGLSDSLVISSDLDQLSDQIPHQIEKLEMIWADCKMNYMDLFYLKDCTAFNDWLFFERENFQKKYLLVLNGLREAYLDKKLYARVVDVLNEMLKMNPYDESIYASLIKVLIMKGDRMEAYRQYKRCVNVLREELNIAPLKSTRKLYDLIESTADQVVDNGGQAIRIEIRCLSLVKIPYGFMSELLSEILKTRQGEDFLRLHKEDYSGLHYLLPTIFNKQHGLSDMALSKDVYNQYIFQLSANLMIKISLDAMIHLKVFNSIDMDQTSLEFVSYLMYQVDLNQGNIRFEFIQPVNAAFDDPGFNCQKRSEA